ncbi:LytTR family DNA-binding domain-containing protein [Thalassotalea sediminis]|uniref:LytTR family DNA-binding domain-containing protein n=1 Tax=Thalassotalea sediminis TaxID=1759089 RepID=UPI00257293E0|nr:LytTR family DNA-binding domain-containing protein [Thalassotalea sediminis]
MDEISLAYAWLFWVVVCFCGFTIYSPIITYGNNFLIQYLPNKLNKYWLRVAIATFVASIVMAFVVPLIIILFFDISMSYFQSIPQHFIAGLFIGGIITFILTVYDLYQEQKAIVVQQKVELVNQQKSGNDRQSPLVKKFMAKLPVAIRGDLLCLQMDDHYLNVYTDKGKHLLLMRFKDALAMLEEYPGLQTHRSWWVAHQAIIGSKKDGRKLILKLKGDIEAPVSNTYLTKVKSLL